MLLMWNPISRKSALFDHVTWRICDSALSPPHLFPRAPPDWSLLSRSYPEGDMQSSFSFLAFYSEDASVLISSEIRHCLTQRKSGNPLEVTWNVQNCCEAFKLEAGI